MADYPAQVIGDKVPLGTKPMGSPSTGTKPVNLQKVGTSVDLNHSTTVQSPSAIASKGTYQVIGDMISLSGTPNKNVGNSTTLLTSDRAAKTSDVGSMPKASVVRP